MKNNSMKYPGTSLLEIHGRLYDGPPPETLRNFLEAVQDVIDDAYREGYKAGKASAQPPGGVPKYIQSMPRRAAHIKHENGSSTIKAHTQVNN